MDDILEKLGLGNFRQAFNAEEITPKIVCLLSMYEMQCLGVTNRSDVMRLRTECAPHGHTKPAKENGFGAGPPQFKISKLRLEALLETGFMVKEIASLLAVSESTIYRRMRVFGLKKRQFTDIGEEELTGVVKNLLEEFPKCGERMLLELLRHRHIQIPRGRLRDILHRHDEDGVRNRRLGRLHRRVYEVQGPNHLWHVDTNHKLIRWSFVIAAGIDGFSRLIMFIRCLDNNTSETLLHVFEEGVEQFGLPLRVRTDKGLENVKIADYMIQRRGSGGILTGRSVHNQRIERLWRDVYDGVLGQYSELFSFMEDEGILDIMNPAHIFALHYVFLHKINEKLDIWSRAWGSHRLRTAGTSPLRLWTAGTMNNPVDQASQPDANDVIPGASGNTVDTRPILETRRMRVEEHIQRQLELTCPHNWTCSNFGIDVYLKAVRIMNQFNV